jgi:hypothetical protein
MIFGVTSNLPGFHASGGSAASDKSHNFHLRARAQPLLGPMRLPYDDAI